jgi:V/A-type H+-transporting ATPase subunit F
VDYFFIGDPELVTAFRFVGIEGAPAFNPEEARSLFQRITQGRNEAAGMVLPTDMPGAGTCRILILTEETADWLGDALTQWQISGRYPLVVEVPGLMGKLEGRKTLVDAIRDAVGIRV